VQDHLEKCSTHTRLLAAAVALAAVELFEAADGFGLMANVYDPVDFAANAPGVALAVVIDRVVPGANGRPVPG
jgi:hypothetical protein